MLNKEVTIRISHVILFSIIVSLLLFIFWQQSGVEAQSGTSTMRDLLIQKQLEAENSNGEVIIGIVFRDFSNNGISIPNYILISYYSGQESRLSSITRLEGDYFCFEVSLSDGVAGDETCMPYSNILSIFNAPIIE